MYAGVHFPSGNEDGLKLGRLVASKVFDRVQPKGAVLTQQRKAAAVAGAAKPTAAVSTEAAYRKSTAAGRRLMHWLHAL